MKRRLHHPVALHSPAAGAERKVGWLELFYDLVYAATIIQLGNGLSGHIGPWGFAGFAALFVPIWFTWTGFTFYSNRFDVDDVAHRAVVFAQMFAIGGMAVSVPAVLDGGHREFMLFYAAARLGLVAMYARAWRQETRARAYTRRFTLGFTAGAALWAASAWVAQPWALAIWAAAIVVDFSVPLSRKARELTARYPPDAAHMSERYGLLTIIVLGESFMKVLSAVAEHRTHAPMLLTAGLGLVICCSLWWLYFDDIAGSRIRRGALTPFIWVYAHLPLTMAVTAVGVAIKKAVLLDPSEIAPAGVRWLVCGTVGLAFLTAGVIDAVTERRQSEVQDTLRVRVRFASALLVLLLVPLGANAAAGVFFALVAAACVAQVLFDIFTTPLAFDEAAAPREEQPLFSSPRTEDPATPGPAGRRRRAPFEDAVRTGAPSDLRRDLYFHLMESSWKQLFAAVVAAFLLVNLAFAAAYMIDPSGVSGLENAGLLEAFSFSVQTFTTIGYGVMAPQSSFAHAVMVVEAFVGLVGAALVTGLVFAKASRPQARVLFSDVAVVTRRFGQPTMMLRLGNARGNEIAEATIRVSVLKEEVSPEGHRLRRLHDVRLQRDSTPIFGATFTLIHAIDGDSPLFGIDETNVEQNVVMLAVTVIGHDRTYAQTVYDRRIYFPDEIRFGHRFVDVVGNLDDGRMLIDYARFHDTIPDQAEDTGG